MIGICSWLYDLHYQIIVRFSCGKSYLVCGCYASSLYWNVDDYCKYYILVAWFCSLFVYDESVFGARYLNFRIAQVILNRRTASPICWAVMESSNLATAHFSGWGVLISYCLVEWVPTITSFGLAMRNTSLMTIKLLALPVVSVLMHV